jgi:hypothetical protein
MKEVVIGKAYYAAGTCYIIGFIDYLSITLDRSIVRLSGSFYLITAAGLHAYG